MKEWNNALKIATKSKMSHDRHTFAMLRNKVIKELRKGKADFITIFENCHDNSKAIWSHNKTLTGQNNIVIKPIELKVSGTILQSG